MATVAAILAEYPADTIRYVTDPRTGIAANPIPDPDTGRVWTGMPNPAEVKRACEAHYGPVRSRIERDKQVHDMLAERAADRALADARPKKTYEQLQAELAEVGIFIGGTKAKPSAFKVDDFLEQHGVSKADWDAIPNRGDYDDMLRRQGLKK